MRIYYRSFDLVANKLPVEEINEKEKTPSHVEKVLMACSNPWNSVCQMDSHHLALQQRKEEKSSQV